MISPIKSLLAISALGLTSACAEETREGRHSETSGAEARAEARANDNRLAENRRTEERAADERMAEERRNEELRAQEQDEQARDEENANDDELLTAQDQSNTESDLAITQAIRSALTGDKSLSMRARNVTIVTEDSVVTLRGNVDSAAERSKVERHSSVEGVARIDNALVVSR